MRNKIYLIILALLGALVGGCAYYNTFYNAKKFYEKANAEREKRRFDQEKPSSSEKQNYDKAIEKASAVLELYPKSKYVDDALMLLGRAFYYQQDYQKAKRKFEEILTFYPDGDFGEEAKLWLARTDMELKNYDEAETILHQLLTTEKIAKNIAENAQIMLGDLYFNKENYLVAADVYKRATVIAHNKEIKSRSYMRLGDSYLELKKYPEAIEAFRFATKKSANNEFKNNAMYKLGQAQSQSENYDEAIKTFTRLLNVEIDNERVPMVKLQIAENIRFKGNIEKAMGWYKSIIEEHKRTDASARSYYAMGLVQEQQADYAKAKESFENVRAEYGRSEILEDARLHIDSITKLLQLNDEIATLEGRKVEKATDEKANKKEQEGIFSSLDPALILLSRRYQGRSEPRKIIGPEADNLALDTSAPGSSGVADNDSTRASGTASLNAEREKENSSRAAKAKELANKKFQLAELLLFQFDQLDSALTEYQEIYANPYAEELHPLAIFSIAYIYDEVKANKQVADSLYQILADKYPETPHGIVARERLNLTVKKVIQDRYKRLYVEAEKTFWDDEDPEGALKLFQVIVDSFPESDFVPKAKYAQAWIYESGLYDFNRAQQMYQEIADKFGKTEYAKKVIPKLEAIKEYEKKLAAQQDSIAKASAMKDSLAALPVQPDTLNTAPADSLAADSTLPAAAPQAANPSSPGAAKPEPPDKSKTSDGRPAKPAREDQDEKSDPVQEPEKSPPNKPNAEPKKDSDSTPKIIDP